jgi:TP901-1 family phage major tail protein
MSGAGIDFLLKIESSVTPGTFTTIGGLRSTQMTINAEGIDKTNVGSSEWKEMLDGKGIRDMSISASGVFTDSATEAQFQSDMLANTLRKFRVHDVTQNKYFEATFKITSLEYQGEHDKTRNWSIKLASSGAVTTG